MHLLLLLLLLLPLMSCCPAWQISSLLPPLSTRWFGVLLLLLALPAVKRGCCAWGTQPMRKQPDQVCMPAVHHACKSTCEGRQDSQIMWQPHSKCLACIGARQMLSMSGVFRAC